MIQFVSHLWNVAEKYLPKHSLISLFNNNRWYLDDILTVNNSNFLPIVNQIYTKEHMLNKANITIKRLISIFGFSPACPFLKITQVNTRVTPIETTFLSLS